MPSFYVNEAGKDTSIAILGDAGDRIELYSGDFPKLYKILKLAFKYVQRGRNRSKVLSATGDNVCWVYEGGLPCLWPRDSCRHAGSNAPVYLEVVPGRLPEPPADQRNEDSANAPGAPPPRFLPSGYAGGQKVVPGAS